MKGTESLHMKHPHINTLQTSENIYKKPILRTRLTVSAPAFYDLLGHHILLCGASDSWIGKFISDVLLLVFLVAHNIFWSCSFTES